MDGPEGIHSWEVMGSKKLYPFSGPTLLAAQQLEQDVGYFLVDFGFYSANFHPNEALTHAEDPVYFHFAIDNQVATFQFAVGD